MIYKDLTPDRWFKFSTSEQLANVGCDIARAIRYRKEDLELGLTFFQASLELLDLTITDPRLKGRGALKELLRVREAWIDYFIYNNDYKTDEKFWNDYFLDFNYMAAIEKGR